jgi:hypothetical protein
VMNWLIIELRTIRIQNWSVNVTLTCSVISCVSQPDSSLINWLNRWLDTVSLVTSVNRMLTYLSLRWLNLQT